jgi:hypothetical protein
MAREPGVLMMFDKISYFSMIVYYILGALQWIHLETFIPLVKEFQRPVAFFN